MRFTSPSKVAPTICLATYGCSNLEKVVDFINDHQDFYEEAGVLFTPSQIAGQYAFEQVKLDRKGYDSRRIDKSLAILWDAGAVFKTELAIARADELINNFTADFGHDEDGEATFRIKAQSYRLKKYDCCALLRRLELASIKVVSVSIENIPDEEFEDQERTLSFRVKSVLTDIQQEEFATFYQYVSVSDNKLTIEDFLDYGLLEYPNFHDESGDVMNLLETISDRNKNSCLAEVIAFIEKENIKLMEGTEIPSLDKIIEDYQLTEEKISE